MNWDLDELSLIDKEIIYKYFPKFRYIVDNNQNQSTYYKNITLNNRQLSHRENKILEVLKNYIKDEQIDILDQFKNDLTVSSAEHIGPIAHPEALTAVYCQSIYRQQKRQKYNLTFACSTVKLANELESRFIYIDNQKKALLPSIYQNVMCLKAPPMQQELLNQLFGLNLINNSNSFVDQMRILNSIFWNNLNSKMGNTFPHEYVMLPMEQIVLDCIVSELKNSLYSWPTKCILNEKFLIVLLNSLDGVRCCWDSKNNSGTHLFWAIDLKGRPQKIKILNNSIVCDATGLNKKITSDNLIELLSGKIIIPAPNLCFLYLAFYCGINLFGGVFQVQYLQDMQEKLLSTKGLFDQDDITIIKSVRTDLYVNFEKREISSFDFNSSTNINIQNKMPELFTSFKNQLVSYESRGCSRFLIKQIH